MCAWFWDHFGYFVFHSSRGALSDNPCLQVIVKKLSSGARLVLKSNYNYEILKVGLATPSLRNL